MRNTPAIFAIAVALAASHAFCLEVSEAWKSSFDRVLASLKERSVESDQRVTPSATDLSLLRAHKPAVALRLLETLQTQQDPVTWRGVVQLQKHLELKPADVLVGMPVSFHTNQTKRAVLYRFMSTVPDPEGVWPDARFTPSFLQSAGDHLDPSFVQHAYTVFPKKAIVLLVDACVEEGADKNELLAACRVLSANAQMDLALRGRMISAEVTNSVVDSVRKLATHDVWWIRFFAARYLLYSPAYRTQDLLVLLQGDEHPIVRRVLRTAK
jgi:hypothetical protein